MDSLLKKLEILGAAAKYDVSCASSGIQRGGAPGSIGSAAACGICHSWTEDGRCLSLLKVLMSNVCSYNCAYCNNRSGNDVPRASFSPQELAQLTMEFYRRNYIEGLFISSAVIGSADYTMELFVKTLELLRFQYRCRGYIHAKVIPGADAQLVYRLGMLADRISCNIEFACKRSMALLAADKSHEAILTPMSYIRDRRLELAENRKGPQFVPAGQTTQLLVGAAGERDLTLLRLTEGLYSRYSLKRVYFSAYIPVASNPNLPALTTKPPLKREHRLYQADWLLRFYGFTSSELLDASHPDLDLAVDPKVDYALRHPELYPVEVNTADYEMLLRIPGIGVTSAGRIVAARKFGSLNEAGLKKIGVVLKRARYFITIQGRFPGSCTPDNPALREVLSEAAPFMQPSLYDTSPAGEEENASPVPASRNGQATGLSEPDVLQLAPSA